jgi:hypothetical protein
MRDINSTSQCISGDLHRLALSGLCALNASKDKNAKGHSCSTFVVKCGATRGLRGLA